MKLYLKIVLLLSVVFSSSIYSQKVESNLDLFLRLAENIANNYEVTYGKQIVPDSSNKTEFSIFYNYWKNRKTKKDNLAEVNIKIDSVRTKYTDLYRNGLFGDYKLVRKVSIYYSGLKPDSSSIVDTLTLENYSSIENSAFPFTKSKIPAEPFWQSLIEPGIYLGVTISVVFLLFTTRS